MARLKKTSPTKGRPPAGPAPALEQRVAHAVEAIKQEWSLATRAITNVGQLVLDACFDGDAHALLESGAQRNAVYSELARRVDTLGVGLSKHMLSVATRIAAYDQLVRGNHWKLLDVGRKEDLLPLREPNRLADGARFAIEMGSTRNNLQRWVEVQQVQQGRARKKRGLTMSGTQRALEQVVRVSEEESILRIGRAFSRAGKTGQRRMVEQVRASREALVALERRLERMMAADHNAR